MRILLVEDDIPLARELKTSLKNQGHAVDHIALGKEALSSAVTHNCNLVILDLGLPDMDGLDVLKSLKQTNKRLPVLILTARDGIESKVTGLDLGADDYLSKPFSSEELFARIRVIERKLGTNDSALICIANVILDTRANTLSVDNTDVPLSRRELMIAKALMEHEGRIQSKDSLESTLYEWGDEISSNAIEVHVSNLRKKLPKDFIHTVRGVGYVVRKV
jgi:two-component system OmpR family response regulator